MRDKTEEYPSRNMEYQKLKDNADLDVVEMEKSQKKVSFEKLRFFIWAFTSKSPSVKGLWRINYVMNSVNT